MALSIFIFAEQLNNFVMQIENFIQDQYPKLITTGLSEKVDSIFPHLIFGDMRRSYLNEFQLYMAHFGEIPNLIVEENINCKKATEWFLVLYKNEIREMHFSKVELESRSEERRVGKESR